MHACLDESVLYASTYCEAKCLQDKYSSVSTVLGRRMTSTGPIDAYTGPRIDDKDRKVCGRAAAPCSRVRMHVM